VRISANIQLEEFCPAPIRPSARARRFIVDRAPAADTMRAQFF
jgi:hypothetical protein